MNAKGIAAGVDSQAAEAVRSSLAREVRSIRAAVRLIPIPRVETPERAADSIPVARVELAAMIGDALELAGAHRKRR